MSQFITLSEAETMTALYRQNREVILDTNYKGQDIIALSESFDRSAIDIVLSHPGCVGIRIYYGMDENLKVHAILVGYNSNNEDLITTATLVGEPEEIIERGVRCPPICPEQSPLNS